jgi:hypothetical protein
MAMRQAGELAQDAGNKIQGYLMRLATDDKTFASMSVAQIAPGNMLSNVTDSNIPDGAVSCTAQVEGSS